MWGMIKNIPGKSDLAFFHGRDYSLGKHTRTNFSARVLIEVISKPKGYGILILLNQTNRHETLSFERGVSHDLAYGAYMVHFLSLERILQPVTAKCVRAFVVQSGE